jgi:hypothetical protein
MKTSFGLQLVHCDPRAASKSATARGVVEAMLRFPQTPLQIPQLRPG